MPLYSLPEMQQITRIPHDKDNRQIINRLTASELLCITEEINKRVDAVVGTQEELITSGWIPGHDWTGTVWEPIYTVSRNDIQRAGMVFGAIVFEVMMNRSENWSLGKYQVNGKDIGSTTYFRIS